MVSMNGWMIWVSVSSTVMLGFGVVVSVISISVVPCSGGFWIVFGRSGPVVIWFGLMLCFVSVGWRCWVIQVCISWYWVWVSVCVSGLFSSQSEIATMVVSCGLWCGLFSLVPRENSMWNGMWVVMCGSSFDWSSSGCWKMCQGLLSAFCILGSVMFFLSLYI